MIRLQIELAITFVTSLVFLILFGNPRRHTDRPMAYHVAAFTAATMIEAASLLAAMRRVLFPLWIYLIVFGFVAAVSTWRLVLYVLKWLRFERWSAMSWVRKVAAVLAGLQLLAGSAALADVIGLKWFGLFVTVVSAAQAFLSAYQRPAAQPTSVTAESVEPPYLQALRDAAARLPGSERLTLDPKLIFKPEVTETDGAAGVTQQSE